LGVKRNDRRLPASRNTIALRFALGLGLFAATNASAQAQDEPVAAPPQAGRISSAPELAGRTVEEVRVLGNAQVSTAVIRNAIRTTVGDRLDPATVEEDYQRIYNLRKFSDVQARVEPTATGVNVVFVVTEQQQIKSISFVGNRKVTNTALLGIVDLRIGEAIDPFRLSLSRNAIEGLYRTRNFPFARITVDQAALRDRGEAVFKIVEGPNVRIRNVDFKGNTSFSESQLKKQIRSASWIFVFRAGRFDPQVVEEDVAALRRFYESKGFFDARVGRKLIWSTDWSELQIDYVITEGQRYTVDGVRFEGNTQLTENQIRSKLKLLEGRPYESTLLQRDVREIVRAYSPFGYIYQPGSNDPTYLRVDAKPVFRREEGKIELLYTIREGKPYRLGQIIIKGNPKSQEKLVLREMRVSPGDKYNAGEIQDAQDRIRGTPYFDQVTVTPIGEDPNYRDLLVEVAESKTASFNVGAGINSNGGIGGNITYQQRNFDIFNLPGSPRDIFSDRSFTGAGQDLRISLEPGTEQSNASIRFTEPWLFDKPYSLTTEGYLRSRQREDYDDAREGGRVSFGKRFNYVWSGSLTLRGENVNIDHIDDDEIRAIEIVEEEGNNTLTSVGVAVRRDTVNPGFLPYRGSVLTAGIDGYGLLGGDYHFQKFSLGYDSYYTLSEDLTDRKTTLSLHGNLGYITGDSVFFERFYGGGLGSLRGFQFRGVSPRSGIDDDPVGGDFIATGSVELNFPVLGENLRGVVFTDFGTVEPEFEVGTIRTSVGAGVRLVLPFLGQAPLAIDFAVPVTKNEEDESQLISFSFGISQ
jgi:outer membrane protein insertion porin family